MTSSNGNIIPRNWPFARGIHRPRWIPRTKASWLTRSFDVFFDLRMNKRLSKQSWSWWFETLSGPLWRHCNEFINNRHTRGSTTWRPSLQWRHNERDGVSNHSRLDCLLNRLFRRWSKKASKLRVIDIWGVIHRWPLTINNSESHSRNDSPPPNHSFQGKSFEALHWRHNDHDGVSNHQPHGCLLNRLFRRRSKKTSKLRVTGLCVGIGPVNSPHKGPVTRKMCPFDDGIMRLTRVLYSARRTHDTKVTPRRRFDVIMTLLLCHKLVGYLSEMLIHFIWQYINSPGLRFYDM